MREKNDSSPTPRLRAISISGFVSWVKVTMPSTCPGSRPASAIAASHASTARRRSERPDSFENSVAPIPTTAAASRSWFWSLTGCVSSGQLERDGAGHVVADLVRAPDLDLDDAVVLPADLPRHRHGVARVVGGAEPDPHALEDGVGTGPIGDEAADEPVRGEDVHEDVGRAALLRQPGIMVHVLVVARRDRGRDDERAREWDDERRQFVADLDVVVAERCVHADAVASASAWPSRASCALAPPSVSSICLPHRK